MESKDCSKASDLNVRVTLTPVAFLLRVIVHLPVAPISLRVCTFPPRGTATDIRDLVFMLRHVFRIQYFRELFSDFYIFRNTNVFTKGTQRTLLCYLNFSVLP